MTMCDDMSVKDQVRQLLWAAVIVAVGFASAGVIAWLCM